MVRVRCAVLLQRHVEDRLSEELLKGNVLTGQHIVLDVVNDELAIKQSNCYALNKEC